LGRISNKEKIEDYLARFDSKNSSIYRKMLMWDLEVQDARKRVAGLQE
jgi:hypothetical protein